MQLPRRITKKCLSGCVTENNSTLSVYNKRFFDHPAISAKDYSDALHESYNFGGKTRELFYWPLIRADRHDLEAVMGSDIFSEMHPKFQEVVNRALQAVGTETRIGITHRKGLSAIKEALEKDVPTVLLELIKKYYLEW